MPNPDVLRLADEFRRHNLPSLLRRLLVWKGLDPSQHHDLIEELEQELWLDCLQHEATIATMPARERHARWFRLLERCAYRLWVRGDRQRNGECEIEKVSGPGGSPSSAAVDPVTSYGGDLPKPQRRFLRALGQEATFLKNGRLNCRASARSLGIREHELKHAWDDAAAGLGWDAESIGFWRRRLVEALVGLAADVLRESRRVTVHGERRRRIPDPGGRLRRIRKLHGRLDHRPMPRDIKHVLTRYRHRRVDLDPRRILADAALLAPDDPTVHLWRFEAALADDDASGAMRAIRSARRCGADGVRALLARARLQEYRGRDAAALRLLKRSRLADPRVAQSMCNLVG